MRSQGLRYDVRTRIDRPVEEVFAHIADLANAMDHEPSILGVQRTSEGPIGVGTTFRQVATDGHGGEHAYQVSILEHRPPTKLVFHQTGSVPGYERTTYLLEPIERGTKLHVSHAGTDMGMKGAVAAMITEVARQRALAALSRLKRHLEAANHHA